MKKVLLASLIATALISGCGGGGGGSTTSSGSTPAVVSSESFQVQNAWINYLVNSTSNAFTLSGTSNSVNVSGSGTATFGQLAATSFEGQPALSKTVSITATLSANGQSFPLSTTSVTFVDTNYNLIGNSSQYEYSVVDAYITPLSNSVKVNDTAILYTEKRYSNSSKSTLIGTAQTSFVLEPETAQTAVLKLINIEKDNFNNVEQTNTVAFRVTPSGAYTRLYETNFTPTSNLRISY